LPDPAVASVCHAYEDTSVVDNQQQTVVVACREANVVLGVSLSGTPVSATPETAIRAAALMAERLRASTSSLWRGNCPTDVMRRGEAARVPPSLV